MNVANVATRAKDTYKYQVPEISFNPSSSEFKVTGRFQTFFPNQFIYDDKCDIKIGPYIIKCRRNENKGFTLESPTEKFIHYINRRKLKEALQHNDDIMIPENFLDIKRNVDFQLSRLHFEKCLVNYNSFDECWNYDLFFPHDIRLNLGVFDDYEEEGVDFIIYYRNDYFLSNRFMLEEVVNTTNQTMNDLKSAL